MILGVICLAQLVVILDNTILNVAIPTLTTDLGASTADIQWVINAYALVQSGLLLSAGSAADRYGRRRMLLTGLALFGLGSFAAARARSTGQLIAARAGMGIGGALLLTTTLAVVIQIFDEKERARAIGIWAAVNALGFAAGRPRGRRARSGAQLAFRGTRTGDGEFAPRGAGRRRLRRRAGARRGRLRIGRGGQPAGGRGRRTARRTARGGAAAPRGTFLAP
ncbi:MFS transporter [Streptomyces sp. GC420]|nr:MFS transporter [Streptomyces sp. GC420]